MTLYTKILNLLNNMNEQEIIEVHNSYCEHYNMQGDFIYTSITDVFDVYQFVYFEDGLDLLDKYFYFNGYERLNSTNNLRSAGLDIREIAENIAVDENDLNNEHIQKAIAEWKEQNTATGLYNLVCEQLPSNEIDHWQSDLYIKVTPASAEIIKHYKYLTNVRMFVDNIDHELWYDVPFAYSPYWTQKQTRKENTK